MAAEHKSEKTKKNVYIHHVFQQQPLQNNQIKHSCLSIAFVNFSTVSCEFQMNIFF